MSPDVGVNDGEAGPGRGSAAEVFRAFLGLGLTSFGGPVAHLGYFRTAFVERRRWMSDAAYADLVALCQFLPGPASSQVGMAIGLQRAGLAGMLAAWTAFTLPSALLLVAFAYGASALADGIGTGWIAGLKAAAVAVVAQALLGMARSLTPDVRRAVVAVVGMALALAIPGAFGQVAAIVAGAILAFVVLERASVAGSDRHAPVASYGRKTGAVWLAVFVLLLVGLPLLAAVSDDGAMRMIDGFYRAGALVFGGGHVVLPLLEAETVATGAVGHEAFLAGYGAAQAVPGPLFTFAAYLGAVHAAPPNGLGGAALALAAIFLPGALLLLGALPFWDGLRRSPTARRALSGINAAVVGLLAAALYDPVLREGITSAAALLIAAAAFLALVVVKAPPWAVVVAAGIAGHALL